MKKILPMALSFIVLAYTQVVSADYVQHQYFYMDMTLNKCTQIVKKSAERVGFKNIHVKTSKNDGFYASLFAMNKKGYSFQYLCESKKGFGYLIINGSSPKITLDIKQKIAKEIYNQKK